jgi:CheY-like chemotaxis protein
MYQHREAFTPDRERLLVLLIEEEPAQSGLLARALRDEGFAVAQADDVADGLRQARDREPDLIVIDPRPTASVARELNRLRADPVTRDLPLIAIRRASSPLARQQVYAWPAQPPEMEVLREHVWRVLNSRLLAPLPATA